MALLDDIIEAMNRLGGHCYYKDLYVELANINPEARRPSVRATIERNSQ